MSLRAGGSIASTALVRNALAVHKVAADGR
jgi:hypothetical protein